jgi:hypothetical protein
MDFTFASMIAEAVLFLIGLYAFLLWRASVRADRPKGRGRP